MKNLKVILEGGSGEITEKKSRFIATVYSVESEEEALERIAEIRKQYYNASHNCFAYVVGEPQEIQRCSDDKEPSGTAGRPILDVLLGEGIRNGLVVVTRYFGGTLLGTGGLVRAYSKAAQAGLGNSVIIQKLSGTLLSMETDYNGIGKIQYLLGQRGIMIMNSQYTDRVTVEALVPIEMTIEVKSAVTESTNGRTIFAKEKSVCYGVRDGEILIF